MNDQLTEDERKQVAAARDLRSRGRPLLGFSDDLLRIIDRLTSAAPVPEGVPEDRIVPEGWRVEWYQPGGAWGSLLMAQRPRLVPLSNTPHEEGAPVSACDCPTCTSIRYRKALIAIRDADPIDMALDPQWPARIAANALVSSDTPHEEGADQ